MARKPETQFISGVHKYLPSGIYHMKNHNAYVAGIADVWYSGTPFDLWAEYKYVPAKRPQVPVVPNLSIQQLRWITDRKHEGRNVWVIVGCESGGVIFHTEEYLTQGMPPPLFLQRLLTRKQIALEISTFCSGAFIHATSECTT